MSPDDPARPLPLVRIKVCGLTRVDDALACVRAGADWIGLNFHPGSARRIDLETAAEIVASLPSGAAAVGLFVDRPPAEVAEVAARVGLRIVQLHGEEPPEDLAALAPLTVVRAFRIGSADDLARMAAYMARADALGFPPHAVLVDAFVPGQAGGTGHSITSDLLALLPAHPRLILAGGLTPENVAARVAQVGPWMVDVASGVESAPGIKDPARVAAFLRAVRATSPKISS